MISTSEQRVSVKLQCPNPLFEKWLLKWRDEAKENNLKTQHTYSLALQSLRKYPLPLQSGKDCKILKGFGNKLCQMLDDYLKKHKNGAKIDYSGSAEKIQNETRNSIGKSLRKNKKNDMHTMANMSTIDYVPSYNSGPYAILITLYKSTLNENNIGFMYKKDIIREAQPYCGSSFTKAQPGTFYTAWNSMKTLLEKKLVVKSGNPAKFSLTNEGIVLGRKLNSQVLSQDDKEQNIEKNNFVEKFSDSPTVTDNLDVCEIKDDISKFQFPQSIPGISSELMGICGSHVQDQVNIEFDDDCVKTVEEYQDIFLLPHSFDIILYVDTQETCGTNTNPQDDPIIAELKNLNVNHEVKNLKVGDYCWICRDRSSLVELVLPYIVERKRMDDLASSIKDGRFYEQKFRLKQCGLQNVVYMVESYGKKDEHVGMPLSSLHQAAVNTLIQDGFCVKFVDGMRGLAEYLSCMSNLICKNYENKTLVGCPRNNITNISISDDLVSLMIFKDFNKFSSKSKNFTVKDMFIKQLLQIKGVSIEKAFSIVEEFPTPQRLKIALIENEQKGVNMISNLKYGKLGKKIGPILANTVHQLYTKEQF